MISKECFTEGWIERVSSEMKYQDKNLIEKVIRAFSLVELLVALTAKGFITPKILENSFEEDFFLA